MFAAGQTIDPRDPKTIVEGVQGLGCSYMGGATRVQTTCNAAVEVELSKNIADMEPEDQKEYASTFFVYAAYYNYTECTAASIFAQRGRRANADQVSACFEASFRNVKVDREDPLPIEFPPPSRSTQIFLKDYADAIKNRRKALTECQNRASVQQVVDTSRADICEQQLRVTDNELRLMKWRMTEKIETPRVLRNYLDLIVRGESAVVAQEAERLFREALSKLDPWNQIINAEKVAEQVKDYVESTVWSLVERATAAQKPALIQEAEGLILKTYVYSAVEPNGLIRVQFKQVPDSVFDAQKLGVASGGTPNQDGIRVLRALFQETLDVYRKTPDVAAQLSSQTDGRLGMLGDKLTQAITDLRIRDMGIVPALLRIYEVKGVVVEPQFKAPIKVELGSRNLKVPRELIERLGGSYHMATALSRVWEQVLAKLGNGATIPDNIRSTLINDLVNQLRGKSPFEIALHEVRDVNKSTGNVGMMPIPNAIMGSGDGSIHSLAAQNRLDEDGAMAVYVHASKLFVKYMLEKGPAYGSDLGNRDAAAREIEGLARKMIRENGNPADFDAHDALVAKFLGSELVFEGEDVKLVTGATPFQINRNGLTWGISLLGTAGGVGGTAENKSAAHLVMGNLNVKQHWEGKEGSKYDLTFNVGAEHMEQPGTVTPEGSGDADISELGPLNNNGVNPWSVRLDREGGPASVGGIGTLNLILDSSWEVGEGEGELGLNVQAGMGNDGPLKSDPAGAKFQEKLNNEGGASIEVAPSYSGVRKNGDKKRTIWKVTPKFILQASDANLLGFDPHRINPDGSIGGSGFKLEGRDAIFGFMVDFDPLAAYGSESSLMMSAGANYGRSIGDQDTYDQRLITFFGSALYKPTEALALAASYRRDIHEFPGENPEMTRRDTAGVMVSYTDESLGITPYAKAFYTRLRGDKIVAPSGPEEPGPVVDFIEGTPPETSQALEESLRVGYWARGFELGVKKQVTDYLTIGANCKYTNSDYEMGGLPSHMLYCGAMVTVETK